MFFHSVQFAAPTYTYQARPSGYRSRFWGGGTPAAQYQTRNQQPNYDRYTGGVSEDEQLARAMRESRQQSKFQCELLRLVRNCKQVSLKRNTRKIQQLSSMNHSVILTLPIVLSV